MNQEELYKHIQENQFLKELVRDIVLPSEEMKIQVL